MAPDGSNFSDAETVMYAKASYKPKEADLKTLDAFVEADVSDPQWTQARIMVKPHSPMTSGDGKEFRVFDFVPEGDGNWERTAYGEEGDYWLLFTVSSRTENGFEKSLPAFESLISAYHEKP